MHQQHSTTTQPANRSIQENTGSRGIQLPSVKVLQQPNEAPAPVVQGVFTDADEVTLNMVANYIKENNAHMLGPFQEAHNKSIPLTIDGWLQINIGVELSQVKSWHDKQQENTAMRDVPLTFSNDSEKASEQPKTTVSPPNSQWVSVGKKGYGVFNLFSFAGKSWIATAFHCVHDLDAGEDSAPVFFKKNGWGDGAQLVLVSKEKDYVLYFMAAPTGKYPDVELATVSSKGSQPLIVQAPRIPQGIRVDTQNVRTKKTSTPDFNLAGVIKYPGHTEGGDSGAALLNVNNQFVGLHQTDFGGIGFEEGADLFKFLMEQKQK